VGLLDLAAPGGPRLAWLEPERVEYAASVAKIAILLAYFDRHPEAATALDPVARHELGLMAKISSNEMAAKYSAALGLRSIQALMEREGFYEPGRGGIWLGKHYGRGDERYPDPVSGHSHAVTVRHVLRYFLKLEQGRLLSPAASATMREVFRSPGLPHDAHKFVAALAGRPVDIVRKWGSWEDWQHDAAVVTGPGRHYILVGLTRHAHGDRYLEALARAVDDELAPRGAGVTAGAGAP
jgi:beta-lactamase class A